MVPRIVLFKSKLPLEVNSSLYVFVVLSRRESVSCTVIVDPTILLRYAAACPAGNANVLRMLYVPLGRLDSVTNP